MAQLAARSRAHAALTRASSAAVAAFTDADVERLMADLGRFVITDMTREEEDAFFGVLGYVFARLGCEGARLPRGKRDLHPQKTAIIAAALSNCRGRSSRVSCPTFLGAPAA